MRRIYRRRFMKLRFWSAVLILVAVAAVAWRLMQVGAPPEGLALGLLRAANVAPVVFVALGVVWLLRRLWGNVGAFDVAAEAGRFRIWLWRPFGWRFVEGDLADIDGWRYEPGRPPTIRARLERASVELVFEVGGGWRPRGDWRRIAPGAVAAYERDMAATG